MMRLKHSRFLFLILLFCAGLTCRQIPRPQRELNLIAALPRAELFWDDRYISSADPYTRSQLLEGWRGRRNQQDAALYSIPPRSTLAFRCLTLTDKIIRFQARSPDGAQKTLTVQINGAFISKQRLTGKAHSYDFSISRKYLRRGLNYLTFISPAALEFDSWSILEQSGEPIKRAAISRVQSSGSMIAAPTPSAAGFYLPIPAGASLEVQYRITKSDPQGAAAKFVATAESDDHAAVELFSDVLEKRWYKFSKAERVVSLQSYGKEPVRLTLESQPVAGKPPASIEWSVIRVLNANATGLNAGKPASVNIRSASTLREPPNVIVYLVDALRPDHLQPYGYTQPITPSLQSFTKDSILFENSYSQVSWTRPSVTTILTGLYPATHLVENRLDALPDIVPTLQQVLKQSSYKNFAFVTQPNIARQFGFSRGFDQYVEVFRSNKKRSRDFPTQSDSLIKAVIDSLNSIPLHRTFLYLHAVDTHGPLAPDGAFLPKDSQCDFTNPEINFAQKYQKQDENNACRVQLYDAAVRQSDFYFGQFLKFLKSKNAYHNSLVVFLADHGESLLEHGRWGHGENLYQPDIRIPVIIKLPNEQFAGKRIAATSREIDIMPTILDYLGIRKPDRLQGESLLSQIENSQDRVVFSELMVDKIRKRAILINGYKLIETSKRFFPLLELYNIQIDPAEKNDLSSQRPVLLGYMRSMLQQFIETQKTNAIPLRKGKNAILDKQTEESLKALGYLQ